MGFFFSATYPKFVDFFGGDVALFNGYFCKAGSILLSASLSAPGDC
jgi:hypothetical protein